MASEDLFKQWESIGRSVEEYRATLPPEPEVVKRPERGDSDLSGSQLAAAEAVARRELAVEQARQEVSDLLIEVNEKLVYAESTLARARAMRSYTFGIFTAWAILQAVVVVF